MKPFFLRAIIQNDIKAAGHGDNQLMQILVCMAAPFRPAGRVVKVINPLDLKGHMPPPLNKSQVAARISDLWQINNFAIS